MNNSSIGSFNYEVWPEIYASRTLEVETRFFYCIDFELVPRGRLAGPTC